MQHHGVRGMANMEGHVLHIGVDDCHRVAVLRSVGYRVDECGSLPQLARALERTKGAVAVFMTESDGLSPEKAISLARERSAAPVILFQSSNQETNDRAFDLVIPPLTSPDRWLREVGALLDGSRGMRRNSSPLTPQSGPAGKARIPRRGLDRPTDSEASLSDLWNSRPSGL